MALITTLGQDSIAARKAGNSADAGVLGLIISQLKNREIEKRATGSSEPLSDEEVLDVLGKEAKKRKEAIELYIQGGRQDLADKEKNELDLLYRYLPRELSREEVDAELEKLFKEEPSREFSVLVKEAMTRMKGKADGKMVSMAIKAKLE